MALDKMMMGNYYNLEDSRQQIKETIYNEIKF